jgi:threonine/homoserine/homoserine lactone efflux protein
MPEDYLAYVGFAMLVVIAPGPDLAVVLKNGLGHSSRDRRAGTWTSVGVVSSLLVQGVAAAFGLAAVIVQSTVLFTMVKYVGAGYLLFLGIQALRSVFRSEGGFLQHRDDHPAGRGTRAGRSARGFQQGFLSNIMNPKVLAFYFSFASPIRRPDEFLDFSGLASRGNSCGTRPGMAAVRRDTPALAQAGPGELARSPFHRGCAGGESGGLRSSPDADLALTNRLVGRSPT